jgi:glycosyltransferase involved in cell wall biosynthesis
MITMLMAVYAGEKPAAFEMALISVVQQTSLPEEVLLIVDGPLSSELWDVIERYKDALPLNCIRLEDNRGLATALNIGLQAAKYPWIMRFDSDDVCYPFRVEEQRAAILEGRYDLFGSQIDEFEHDAKSPSRRRSVPVQHENILLFAKIRCPFNHQTVCYRKELAISVGGYPQNYRAEDYALWIKMIGKGAKLYNHPQALVAVRIGNGMIERRGGFGYAKSEFGLQRLMFDLGIKSGPRAIFDSLIRGGVFVAPCFVRRFLYARFLRS